MAHFSPKRQAAINMDHYLTADGQDRELSPGNIDEVFGELTANSAVRHQSLEQGFLDKIKEDLSSAEPGTIRRYNSLNTDNASANFGEAWFGLSTAPGENWYYAVGSFWLAFGGRARRIVGGVEIYYRAYIYDRYNWDVEKVNALTQGKVTRLPSSIDWAIDEDVLTDPNMPEFRKWQPDYVTVIEDDPTTSVVEEGYIVNDALFGMMGEFGEAKPFDIVGSGRIRSVVLSYGAASQGGATVPPESGVR